MEALALYAWLIDIGWALPPLHELAEYGAVAFILAEWAVAWNA